MLLTREHRAAIADLSDAEVEELGPLLRLMSTALHDVVGALKTYVAQFAEHPLHPHVHFHVIPRRQDHPEIEKGPHVFTTAPDGRAVVTEARMNEISEAVREVLRSHLVEAT